MLLSQQTHSLQWEIVLNLYTVFNSHFIIILFFEVSHLKKPPHYVLIFTLIEEYILGGCGGLIGLLSSHIMWIHVPFAVRPLRESEAGGLRLQMGQTFSPTPLAPRPGCHITLLKCTSVFAQNTGTFARTIHTHFYLTYHLFIDLSVYLGDKERCVTEQYVNVCLLISRVVISYILQVPFLSPPSPSDILLIAENCRKQGGWNSILE